MTLGKLLLFVAIAALVLTLITMFVFKKHKNIVISFLQNFAGALFVFSGWVKVVDPLGTAYKMEQYFAEFESVFEPTMFSFMAPLFPFLANYAVSFSMFMIVLEIVLGVMLIIGSNLRFAKWAFLLIVGFFTILTGFTHLTGYVPSDATFFEFSKWGPYEASNRKVTDCGCFGDFIKLDPTTSFMKDIFLLLPAFIFLFFSKKMHEWFNKPVRNIIVLATLGGAIFYGMNNYVWDIPKFDFRPFKAGADIRSQKSLEEEAAMNVEIIGWKMQNEGTQEVVSVNNPDYSAVVAQYPKDQGWKVLDQIKSEPLIEATKISDFGISGTDGYDKTEEILQNPDAHFMIVSYELKFKGQTEKEIMVPDTVFAYDTIVVLNAGNTPAEPQIVRKIAEINEKPVRVTRPNWNAGFVKKYKSVILPFAEKAAANNIPIYGVTKPESPENLSDFLASFGGNFPFHTADDILLKTIVRSNPGIVLWKDGKILDKWHYKKLPAFEEIQQKYLQ